MVSLPKTLFALIFYAGATAVTAAADRNPAADNETSAPVYHFFSQDKLNITVLTGIINVKAQEYFYHTVYGIMSRLIWHTTASPMIKTVFAYKILPKLTFSTEIWSVIPQKRSVLDDYDFLDGNYRRRWTNWSQHGSTKLKANGYDLSLKYRLISEQNPLHLSLLLGWQNNLFQWIAPNKAFMSYEQLTFTTRGFKGYYSWPGHGISYKQRFEIPYLGFNTGIDCGQTSWALTFKYSQLGVTKLTDIHHNRDLQFRDSPVKKPKFYNLTFDFIRRINSQLSFKSQMGITYIPLTPTLKSSIPENMPAAREYFPGGVKHISKTFLVGINYHF